jgi:hypothetical protein
MRCVICDKTMTYEEEVAYENKCEECNEDEEENKEILEESRENRDDRIYHENKEIVYDR